MKIELNRDGELCPACGEGSLISHVGINKVEHEGVSGEVLMCYSLCDHCGSELAGPAEIQANKRAITIFKKKAERLLTGSEIRALRKNFELTQTLAAELFGGGKVAFSRYENDDITQSVAMDSLLRLCADNNSNLLLLAVQKKIDLPESFVSKVKARYFLDQIADFGNAIRYELDHNRFQNTMNLGLKSCKPIAANAERYFGNSSERVAEVSMTRAWGKVA
ncbi:MAG: type II toxin-antitoxin system MqsA family antitoxin [Nitrosospira sp.]